MSAIPPEYLNQIVTGDARELAQRIPDESVDLIFTDPVYFRLEDYRWLAYTAARVLKPNSAALVWCENSEDVIVKYVVAEYLSYVLTLHVFASGVTVGRHYRGMFVKSSPCLWLEKGTRNPYKRIWDVSIGVSNSDKYNDFHEWNKDPQTLYRWCDAFSLPDAIVFDPFTGGGAVPAVCKMLGRNYIAFEIDPATAERARERVRNTQPPLFVLQPEQSAMEFSG